MKLYIWQLTVVLSAHFQYSQVNAREDFALFCGFVSEGQRYDIYVGSLNSESFSRLPITISGVPNDVSYDPVTDKIYWIETLNTWTGEGADRMCTLSSSISRCDYNGSNQEHLITGISMGANCIGAGYPKIELDIESRRMYWMSKQGGSDNLYEVNQATMDGTEVRTIAVKRNDKGWSEISLDKVTYDLYWSVYDPGNIYRLNLDGTIETIIENEWGISSVAVNNEDGIFWTTYAPNTTVQTSNLQGTDRRVVYQEQDNSVFSSPNHILVYQDEIYFVLAENDRETRNLYRIKKDSGEVPIERYTGFDVRCTHIHEKIGTGTVLPTTVLLPTLESTDGSSNSTLEIAIVSISTFIAIFVVVAVSILVFKAIKQRTKADGLLLEPSSQLERNNTPTANNHIQTFPVQDTSNAPGAYVNGDFSESNNKDLYYNNEVVERQVNDHHKMDPAYVNVVDQVRNETHLDKEVSYVNRNEVESQDAEYVNVVDQVRNETHLDHEVFYVNRNKEVESQGNDHHMMDPAIVNVVDQEPAEYSTSNLSGKVDEHCLWQHLVGTNDADTDEDGRPLSVEFIRAAETEEYSF